MKNFQEPRQLDETAITENITIDLVRVPTSVIINLKLEIRIATKAEIMEIIDNPKEKRRRNEGWTYITYVYRAYPYWHQHYAKEVAEDTRTAINWNTSVSIKNFVKSTLQWMKIIELMIISVNFACTILPSKHISEQVHVIRLPYNVYQRTTAKSSVWARRPGISKEENFRRSRLCSFGALHFKVHKTMWKVP